MRKKIIIRSRDTIGDVREKIQEESLNNIVLDVPEKSLICTEAGFKELKEISDEEGKEIIIESQNETVLSFAEEAGFSTILEKDESKSRPILDIIQRGMKNKLPAIPEFLKHHKDIRENAFAGDSFPERKSEKEDSRKKIVILASSLAAVIAVLAFLYFELPRATIVIELKKTEVQFSGPVDVSSKAFSPSTAPSGRITIPGELLTAKRNLELSFPSSGKEMVEVKSSGKLAVYNAYGSQSQPIVATTRFISPDGKVFRLDKKTVIPGANVINGKITPSQIEVSVTADKPGEEYNVASSKGWKIPGFSGTPKYEGFYAEAVTPMSGGARGEKLVPTESDITNAKQALQKSLMEGLDGELAVLMSPKFVLLPDTKEFTMNSIDVERITKDAEKFSVFGEAEMRGLVFEKQMLNDEIAKNVLPTLKQGLVALDFDVSYRGQRANLSAGTMSFLASSSVVFEENLDKNKFNSEILGMTEDTLKRYVFSIPGLEKATISLWPFWVSSVPGDSKRVTITFQ